jgi:sec-independent protein translocase protein TatA
MVIQNQLLLTDFREQESDMIGGIGMPELIIILVIILIIFGAGKLPEIGAGLGKGIKNFKSATKEPSVEADSKEDKTEQIEEDSKS